MNLSFNFELLSRSPDFEASNLQAYDASDRLILAKAQEIMPQITPVTRDDAVTVGDRYGALTLGLSSVFGEDSGTLRVYQDGIVHERALAQNAARIHNKNFRNLSLEAELFARAKLILMQLPRSLSELRELADAIARYAHPEAVLVAGRRIKHMSPNMNVVLHEYFGEVQAGLAKQKSRVLVARGPLKPAGPPPFPVWKADSELAFKLASFGATFGGSNYDHGTRLLLNALDKRLRGAKFGLAVDLGCGNGTVATKLALALPDAIILGVDQNYSATRATSLTVQAAGVQDRVTVTRADGCENIASDSVDLVVLNPPFHSGAQIENRIAAKLITDAARVLKPGGELWLVMNSHLPHKQVIAEKVGVPNQVVRDARFTVLRTEKRGL